MVHSEYLPSASATFELTHNDKGDALYILNDEGTYKLFETFQGFIDYQYFNLIVEYLIVTEKELELASDENIYTYLEFKEAIYNKA